MSIKEVTSVHDSVLIDQMHDAVITTNLDGVITGWNRGAEVKLGYAAAEAIGKPIYFIYPEEKKDISQSEMIALLEGKGSLEFEAVMRRKSGDEIIGYTSISPLYDVGGSIHGMVSYTLDITERKRAEDALREQAMIIDQIHDAVIATDLDGIITRWNSGAQSQLGYAPDEVIGQPIYLLYPQEKKDVSQGDVIGILDRDGRLEFEGVMRKKSGEEIIVHTSLSALKDRHGVIQGMLSYTLDITARKRGEAAMLEKQRLDQELDIAKHIQQGLLPTEPPDVEGFKIAGWNQAADHTGGEYFDWLTLPDGRTLLSVADVSGHGIGPALIVAVCRAYFRASASIDDTLKATISRVNDLLSHDLPPGSFVTVVIGFLESKSATLQLHSAGHAPLLFY